MKLESQSTSTQPAPSTIEDKTLWTTKENPGDRVWALIRTTERLPWSLVCIHGPASIHGPATYLLTRSSYPAAEAATAGLIPFSGSVTLTQTL